MNNTPRHLAKLSFIICAMACGASYSANGGTISGLQSWAMAIGFTLVVSTVTAFLIWAVSRMILARKQHTIQNKNKN